MTATNATEPAPVELAPVACAPVAARVDMVRGCCVRMISLLNRIWVGVLTTFGRDGPSRAAALDHLPLGAKQSDPEDEQSGYQQGSSEIGDVDERGSVGWHPAWAWSRMRR
jgi:hypothetical protein